MSTLYLIDERAQKALEALDNELCSLERTSGREYFLVLVPGELDETICMSQNGKPLSLDSDMRPEEFLGAALARRRSA